LDAISPDEDGPQVELMRDAARRLAATTSLRFAARSIGMSPMGLRSFIAGTAPYSQTLRKLRVWYVRSFAESAEAITTEDVRSVFEVLLLGYPEQERDAAAVTLFRSLTDLFTRRGLPLPPWLVDAPAGRDV
jgi:hypothetical protein